MKLNITLFKSHVQYNEYIENIKFNNVSYCDNENEVHYNPIDFSEQYLTTIARENGTISFNIAEGVGTNLITSISYSMDNGATWTTTTNQDNKEENLVITVNLNAGDKVLWKGIAETISDMENEEISYFTSTCEFDIQGNVMSLCYGDNFIDEDTLEYAGQFGGLFGAAMLGGNCSVVNAKNLSLPATTLSDMCYYCMFRGCTALITAPVLAATTLAGECYENMFYGCTSLTSAPVLPATTLSDMCYYSMFADCTSLTTAPALPATTLAESCYDYMFYSCTSLSIAPKLPATTLAESCYECMFENCTSLTSASELPATTLADRCYSAMFEGCTSLTIAPELPATILATYCYSGMFAYCTSLTSAPELPATTLANQCYQNMFVYCTSLISAPELTATTLVNYCYQGMFAHCTSLNSITCLAINISANACTNSWVQDVASSGIFTKGASINSWTIGTSGIPSGWTVQTASA